MKSRVFVFLVMAFCMCVAAKGATPPDSLTAARVFADIPLEALDMLRPSTRLDMLDYYTQADSLWSAPDALGGKSRLEVVTDDYLRVKVTPVSTLEVKVLPFGGTLPFNKGVIVMTLYTVGGDGVAEDTDVRFFDEGLRPIRDKGLLKVPEVSRFFSLKGSGVSESELRELIPFAAVKLTTGPGETPLTATLTSLEMLPEETRKQLLPLLIPQLTAKWNKSYRFKDK